MNSFLKNSKHEAPNSKQAQNLKVLNFPKLGFVSDFRFRISSLTFRICFGFLISIFGFLLFPSITHAATLYWVGNDGASIQTASNWKTTDPSGCGSGDSGSAPGSADTAVFDADCDNGAAIDANWDLLKLQTNSGYTGTVTQAAEIKNV